MEDAEVRGTRWEVRSIKSGRLRLQVFSIDNKWRAARLAELSLRTSHLVLVLLSERQIPICQGSLANSALRGFELVLPLGDAAGDFC